MTSNFDATFEENLPGMPSGAEGIVSVSVFTSRIQRVLETALPMQWVQGEISNFMQPASGHWYFNLKDDKAQIRCVMFRSRSARLDWAPRNGMAVELRGLTTFYAGNGSCQIVVESMRQTGLGKLFEAFTRLKAQLAEEGLFDEARKRPLPPHPQAIGIVTSPSAAALRDVISTLKRRSPGTLLILYPTPVQGEGAAEQIARAIETAGERQECDLLILCRGGGSIEDLWAFNEAVVARAVAASPIPVITGVGHETDFTMVDFVADRRAPTPTAAAEMVSANREEQLRLLSNLTHRLHEGLQRFSDRENMRLDHLLQRLDLSSRRTLERERERLRLLHRRMVHPGERVKFQRESLESARIRLEHASAKGFTQREHRLIRAEAALGHLNPTAVLSRGFSIVRRIDGQIVRQSDEINAGDSIEIRFSRGEAAATVTKTAKN